MQWHYFVVDISGLVIIFFYGLSRFNNPPPAPTDTAPNDSKVLSTIRQWFYLRDPPTPMILPPPRANTTAFKFWLYRTVYAVVGVGIYLLVRWVPGLREPIPVMVEMFGLPQLPNLNLANGVVLALLLVVLSRMPPLRGADASIRRALYERASIPAHQLSFQFSLRSAPFQPDDDRLETVRTELTGDKFDAEDIQYDAEATTRSLWTKVNLLMRQLEEWAQMDQYKTAFALMREPGTEKLSVDQVRAARDALRADARICLEALRYRPGDEETAQREALFRQECKVLLDAIYHLITRVMLRSHFSYYDAIAGVKRAGFDVSVSTTPLPNKNDLVALILLFFVVVTVPLSYVVGFYRAMMITVIYVLSTLTPIYLAAEWPKLLHREANGMPPLAFPIVSGVLAGCIGFVVGVAIGSVQAGEGAFGFSLTEGLARWSTVSYPWTILVCGITGGLSVLMLIGRYPDTGRLQGFRRYRQWISPADGLSLAAFTLGLMLLVVFPMLVKLVPEYYSWDRPVVIARPVMTALVIGLLVPTWYRGNRDLLVKQWRRHAS